MVSANQIQMDVHLDDLKAESTAGLRVLCSGKAGRLNGQW